MTTEDGADLRRRADRLLDELLDLDDTLAPSGSPRWPRPSPASRRWSDGCSLPPARLPPTSSAGARPRPRSVRAPLRNRRRAPASAPGGSSRRSAGRHGRRCSSPSASTGASASAAALKLLHRGRRRLADSLARRFEQERQILAALEHPNIARVLDGGVAADGRPFLVLELVDGEPIDVWCARDALALAARLELLLVVARTVHFAHRNLIVHRDLKPSNVLVTVDGQGEAARFRHRQAPRGLPRPSPALRSPPRDAHDGAPDDTGLRERPSSSWASVITTASDVYQLGLLLYELVGGRPRSLPRGQLARARARGLRGRSAPARPSAGGHFRRRSPGRARAGRPRDDRLQGAAEGPRAPLRLRRAARRGPRPLPRRQPVVAARHGDLSGAQVRAPARVAVRARRRSPCSCSAPRRPLSASPPGSPANAIARAPRPAARRRSPACWSACSTPDRARGGRGARRPRAARPGRRAPRERARARARAPAHAAAPGRRDEPAPEPRRRGRTAGAPRAELARAAAAGGDAAARADVARAELLLGWAADAQGRYAESARLYLSALRALERLTPRDEPEIFLARLGYGNALQRLGRPADAAVEIAASLAAAAGGVAVDAVALGNAWGSLSVARLDAGDAAGAEAAAREGLRGLTAAFGPDHPRLLFALGNLARALETRGDLDGALETRRSIEMRRRVYGEESPAMATALHNLARLESVRGRIEAACETGARALALRERLLGAGHRTPP